MKQDETGNRLELKIGDIVDSPGGPLKVEAISIEGDECSLEMLRLFGGPPQGWPKSRNPDESV